MVTKLLRSMVAAGVAGFVLKKVDAALKAKQYSHKDQDQAEHEHFETIGERLGPFDLTMMEVGAYDQRWPDVHLGPEQALKAHAMVGGDILLPIHWGTFNLAMHSWVEPMERMLQGAREANVRLVTPRPGQTINASAPPAPQRWWPADVAWRPASAYPVESTGL